MKPFTITVCFEIHRPKASQLTGQHWTKQKSLESSTVSRLLGRRLDASLAFNAFYEHESAPTLHESLTRLSLIDVRGTNSILVMTFDLTSKRVSRADDLRRVASRTIRAICSKLGVQLKTEHYIYGVAASVSSPSLGIKSNVQDCWMHYESSSSNTYISSKIQEELAIRIAIERALLAKALDEPSNALLRWGRTPYAVRLARSFPVELLIDRQIAQIHFNEIRQSMNLSEVREEIFERGRIWYVSVGTFLGFIAATVGVAGLYK